MSFIQASVAAAFLGFCIFYMAMWLAARAVARLPSVGDAVTASGSRYGALDGLRGVLAYGVMFSHGFAGYAYFVTGAWTQADNAVLIQLAQTTVALFFMITGFLFTDKCIAGKIDWRALYISRLFRLGPLYVVVMLVMFLVLFCVTGFQLFVPLNKLILALVKWLTFGITGRPDINDFKKTWVLIAGVNWTLRYEWYFYVFAIPAISLLLRVMAPRAVLGGVLLCLLAIGLYGSARGGLTQDQLCVAHFLAGIAAAFIYNTAGGQDLIRWRGLHLAALCALPLLVLRPFGTVAVLPDLLAAFVIFLSVLGGGSLWGLLKTRAAIWLGDISYGVYLTHGLTLWLLYAAARRTPLFASLETGLALPFLIAVGWVVLAIASLSYLRLERPAMRLGRQFGRARRRSLGAT